MDATEKNKIIEIIAYLSVCDGELSVDEKDCIFSIATDLGIEGKVIAEIIKKAENKNIDVQNSFDSIKTEDAKENLIKLLLIISHADGHFSSEEKKGYNFICKRLGISQKSSRKFIKDIHTANKNVQKSPLAFDPRPGFNNILEGIEKKVHINPEDVSKTWIYSSENKNKKMDELLEKAIHSYNNMYRAVQNSGEELYSIRQSCVEIIKSIQELVNSISNHPKDYDTNLEQIEIEWKWFDNSKKFEEDEMHEIQESIYDAGVGMLAGVGLANAIPASAMWIATTFGTASTGIAISSLTGAAADSAALAWLGGGALSIGGGGVAAGEALLTLAGPLGISVAGVTMMASIALFSFKKNKLIKEQQIEILKIKRNEESLRVACVSINSLKEKHNVLFERLSEQYNQCDEYRNISFESLDKDARLTLGALVNNTLALSKLVSENIKVDLEEDDNGNKEDN